MPMVCRHCFKGNTLLIWTREHTGWYAYRWCMKCGAQESHIPEATAGAGVLQGRDFL